MRLRPISSSMSSAKKAHKYIQDLDYARSRGSWDLVPRFCDKVAKYAPSRTLYIQSARLDYLNARLSSDASLAANTHEVENFEAALQKTQELASAHTEQNEDLLQAQLSIAWGLFWKRDAASRQQLLQLDISDLFNAATAGGIDYTWTRVNYVRYEYARAQTFESLGQDGRAAERYARVLNDPDLRPVKESSQHALFMWFERLVMRACLFSAKQTAKNRFTPEKLLSRKCCVKPENLMKPFRVFGELMSGIVSSLWNEQCVMELNLRKTREEAWRSYYNTLSIILQAHIPLPAFPDVDELLKELEDVQRQYWQILHIEEKYPAADTVAPVAKEWIHQLAANWHSVMNLTSFGIELKPGSKRDWTRTSISHLQQAMALTNDAVPVLRNLSVAHAAVGDFELAKNALFQLVNIVDTQQGKYENLCPKETVNREDLFMIRSLSSGLEMVCKYSSKLPMEPEFAKGQKLLEEALLAWDNVENFQGEVPKAVLSEAGCAVGIAKLALARETCIPEQREECFKSARKFLKLALSTDIGLPNNIKALFNQGLCSVYQDDFDGAITHLKDAIREHAEFSVYNDEPVAHTLSEQFRRPPILSPEKRCILLKCYHTLALLLTGREQYEKAKRTVSFAFDPYGGASLMRGQPIKPNAAASWSMDERFELISLKMTEISINSGLHNIPSLAMLQELVQLFSQLLDPSNLYAEPTSPKPEASVSLETKSKRKGFRHSVLNFSRTSKQPASSTPSISVSSVEPSLAGTHEPSRFTLKEGEEAPLPFDPKHSQAFLGRHESTKLRKRPSRKSLNSTNRSGADSPSAQVTATKALPSHLSLPIHHRGLHMASNDRKTEATHSPDEIGVAMTHDLPLAAPSRVSQNMKSTPLSPIASAANNMDHEDPNESPIPPQPANKPRDDGRDPTVVDDLDLLQVPEVQFAEHLQERRGLIFTCYYWIFVASVYHEAKELVEGGKAIDEANRFQSAVLQDISNNEGCTTANLQGNGFPGFKAHAQMCADIIAEKGSGIVQRSKSPDVSPSTRESLKQEAMGVYRNALHLHPDNLKATLGVADLTLEGYKAGPTYPIGNDGLLDLEVLPINRPLLNAQLMEEIEKSVTDADKVGKERDAILVALKRITNSFPGYGDVEALDKMASAYKACDYALEADRIFLTVVGLRSPVRPVNVLTDLY